MASAGKKVLILVQNLPVPFDRRVWLEAKTLTKEGYQVSVICPMGQHGKYSEKYQFLENIHIYRYPAPPTIQGVFGYFLEFIYCWLWTGLLSLRVRGEQGFDVIHACNPPETFFLLAWFYRPSGVRFLFDHHDLSPEMYLAKGGKPNGILYKALLWLEFLTFRTADVVIATNQSHREIAIDRGRVSADRIFIVRSGPDLERLQIKPTESVLKGVHEYMVCYLGEMCEQDGVDRLLYAAEFIVNSLKRSDIRFVFLGGGPELPMLKQLRDRLELSQHVEFLGRVSDDDLCRYLSNADVCVDPDPYTEWSDRSTMNKIMEYMFFGKPIVAFDLTENRYSAGEAAVYASTRNDPRELATNIVALLNNPQKREEMGEWGRDRVHRHFLWQNSEPPLLAAYHQLFMSFRPVSLAFSAVGTGSAKINSEENSFGHQKVDDMRIDAESHEE